MASEIERKFLVVDEGWRDNVGSRFEIADHLIARFDNGKARIRFCGEQPMLTIKGARRGLKRSEYHIPLADEDARAIVKEFSSGPALEKIRNEVDVCGLIWQVDEYLGLLSGLVTADVELPDEDYPLVLPDWAGPEITADPRFSSGFLADAAASGGLAARNLAECETGRNISNH
ncbi:adenylate cyclase (plasmid) [Rhizobium sp. WSM1274]|uniref:CYTH domain-containing protein n=1 Tax=Rhizobium sp. WSM1274 TaxID=3138254 RepID=UPI0021A546BF|nr:CYTH domain-containing protein [Rhizobium leguminosarum]UWU31045.1 adenylate cyclase [Rhizobium leguminosarum bv. viciae]